jgi:hypothetical protein
MSSHQAFPCLHPETRLYLITSSTWSPNRLVRRKCYECINMIDRGSVSVNQSAGSRRMRYKRIAKVVSRQSQYRKSESGHVHSSSYPSRHGHPLRQILEMPPPHYGDTRNRPCPFLPDIFVLGDSQVRKCRESAATSSIFQVPYVKTA